MSEDDKKDPLNSSSTPVKDPWRDGEEVSEPVASSQRVSGEGGNEGVDDSIWQRDLINRLAFASINEQRRTRRWGIFFKFLFFAYIFIFFILILVPRDWSSAEMRLGGQQHTALIEVAGVIAADSPAGADAVVGGLRAAFEDENTKGVILRINSPGGSPVQSGYIYDEIKRLRGLNPDIPLYAVVVDVCASGGYYIAAAADEIYADKASMVGSIGVLMNGFGFTGAMEKLGIERRLMTAGESKSFLDPFSPVKQSDVEHVQGMLGNIHQQFIDAVKDGRGERLADSDEIFTGLVWSGEQAQELGLVDALGSSSYVAREVIGAETIVDFTARPDYFEQFADRIGATMAKVLSEQMGMSLQ